MPTDMQGVTSKNRTNNVIDAVYADPSENQVNVEDFMQMMIAQMKNQDFMNPVDDTQYMAQLAQFTTLQEMQNMSYNTKTSMMAGLIGKNVVAAKINVSGNLDKTEGTVEKVSLVDNEFTLYVKGQSYTLDQIMQITDKPAQTGTGGDDSSSSDKEDSGTGGEQEV